MDRSEKKLSATSDDYREIGGAVGALGGIAALTETAGAAVWLAPVVGGPAQDVPLANPFALYWRLFATHELAWSTEATAAVTGLGVAGCAACVGAALGWRWLGTRQWGRRAGGRETVDAQAKYMARGRELLDVGKAAMSAKAAKLRVALAEGQEPGVSIGRTVVGNKWLYGSYEDLHVDIWGPRAGKTTSRVIPAVMEAIGPVVATSNKRDVVDATRDPRSSNGSRVWVFDPQGVAAEPPTWYWDPIAWVRGDGEGVQERAIELAGHFASGGDADKRDSFFDPEGEDLLAGLIMAAVVGERSISQVFLWVTKPANHEPIELLDAAGYQMVAAALSDQYEAPDRQRAGIFSTAKKMAACLKLDAIAQWVNPPAKGTPRRRAFDAAAFAASAADTLYPLSLEGKASAGPLVTALTAAVVGEASKIATAQGGRRRIPMTVVLDEAANIVKWRELPAQYSHFGSRGIIVLTILQSWAQGVRCWGLEGMKALWGAANVRVLGSGLSDAAFLREISELIGPHWEPSVSVTRSKGGSSQQHSRSKEITLDPSDLAELPRGRAVVFMSGKRTTLMRTVPWFERPYAAEVTDSIAAHDPANNPAPKRNHLRVVTSAQTEQKGDVA